MRQARCGLHQNSGILTAKHTGGTTMADENGVNGSSSVVFTNVRVLDGSGEYPFTGEVTVQGNRITLGDPRLLARGGRRRRRSDRHRRHGRDADAGPLRRASASVLEQRSRHRSHSDDAAGGAYPGHGGDGQAGARRRLHQRPRRGGGQAAARRGHPQLHQRRPRAGAALQGRRAGNHHGRRARRLRALAYPA